MNPAQLSAADSKHGRLRRRGMLLGQRFVGLQLSKAMLVVSSNHLFLTSTSFIFFLTNVNKHENAKVVALKSRLLALSDLLNTRPLLLCRKFLGHAL